MDENEKLQEILKRLDHFDWKKYEQVSDKQSIILLEFISRNIGRIEEKDIPSLLSAANNLDGAYSESYAAIIGELFLRDRSPFISSMASIEDPRTIMKISDYIAYYCSCMDRSDIEKRLQDLSEQESGKNKEMIDDLLNALARHKS